MLLQSSNQSQEDSECLKKSVLFFVRTQRGKRVVHRENAEFGIEVPQNVWDSSSTQQWRHNQNIFFRAIGALVFGALTIIRWCVSFNFRIISHSHNAVEVPKNGCPWRNHSRGSIVRTWKKCRSDLVTLQLQESIDLLRESKVWSVESKSIQVSVQWRMYEEGPEPEPFVCCRKIPPVYENENTWCSQEKTDIVLKLSLNRKKMPAFFRWGSKCRIRTRTRNWPTVIG